MAIQKRKGKTGTTYRVEIYHQSKRVAYSTFDSLSVARQYETDVKAKLYAGTYVDKALAENMTLCEALDKYTDTVSRKKKGDAYRREYSQAKQIKKYHIAKLSLARIKTADIAAFRDARGQIVGVNSVRLGMALISNLFTVAIQEWSMDYLTNPVTNTKKVSVLKTRRDRRLESGEYRGLMRSAKAYGGNMRLIIPFAIETAMRQGEIVSIRSAWVDLMHRVIHLPDSKNGEARDVPMSRRAYHIVKIALSSGASSVFGMTCDGVRTAWVRICARAVSAPIAGLHFHDLRHEATSRLFEKGLSTEQVKAITGHKTYSMLARYTHLKAADLVKLLK